MRMPLHNREPGKESGPEERGAHLANASTNPLHRLITNDNNGFSITIFKADVSQIFCHGENLARRDEHAMKAGSRSSNILDAIRR